MVDDATYERICDRFEKALAPLLTDEWLDVFAWVLKANVTSDDVQLSNDYEELCRIAGKPDRQAPTTTFWHWIHEDEHRVELEIAALEALGELRRERVTMPADGYRRLVTRSSKVAALKRISRALKESRSIAVDAKNNAIEQARSWAQEARTLRSVLMKTAEALGITYCDYDGSIPLRAEELRQREEYAKREGPLVGRRRTAGEDLQRGDVITVGNDGRVYKWRPEDGRS